MIGIIDYGMGNLRSVQKAFEKLGEQAEFCTKPSQVLESELLVLPGVGAFRDAIAELKRLELDKAVHEYVSTERPLLGICLGLQLLFDLSYEDGEYEGLGVVSGDVVRFMPEPGLKIPHMGWNELQLQQPDCPLLDGIQPRDHVYFVHSYYVRPQNEDVIATTTQHGSQKFCSMICEGNLFATQFHPEKSQRVGLQLLENFAKLGRESLSS